MVEFYSQSVFHFAMFSFLRRAHSTRFKTVSTSLFNNYRRLSSQSKQKVFTTFILAQAAAGIIKNNNDEDENTLKERNEIPVHTVMIKDTPKRIQSPILRAIQRFLMIALGVAWFFFYYVEPAAFEVKIVRFLVLLFAPCIEFLLALNYVRYLVDRNRRNSRIRIVTTDIPNKEGVHQE